MSPGLTQWAQWRDMSSHKNLSLPPHLSKSLLNTPYRADYPSPSLRPWDLTMVVHPTGAPAAEEFPNGVAREIGALYSQSQGTACRDSSSASRFGTYTGLSPTIGGEPNRVWDISGVD